MPIIDFGPPYVFQIGTRKEQPLQIIPNRSISFAMANALLLRGGITVQRADWGKVFDCVEIAPGRSGTVCRYKGKLKPLKMLIQPTAVSALARFKNLIALPKRTCYMQGRSRPLARPQQYFVFYDPDDREAFDAGFAFSKNYAKLGRRFMQATKKLVYLDIPYTVSGLVTYEDAKYEPDLRTLWMLTEELPGTSADQREQYKLAILGTYLGFDLDEHEFWPQVEHVKAREANTDYIMDEFFCRLAGILSPETQVAGWLRYINDKRTNREPGTEVMICSNSIHLLHPAAECNLAATVQSKKKSKKATRKRGVTDKSSSPE